MTFIFFDFFNKKKWSCFLLFSTNYRFSVLEFAGAITDKCRWRKDLAMAASEQRFHRLISCFRPLLEANWTATISAASTPPFSRWQTLFQTPTPSLLLRLLPLATKKTLILPKNASASLVSCCSTSNLRRNTASASLICDKPCKNLKSCARRTRSSGSRTKIWRGDWVCCRSRASRTRCRAESDRRLDFHCRRLWTVSSVCAWEKRVRTGESQSRHRRPVRRAYSGLKRIGSRGWLRIGSRCRRASQFARAGFWKWIRQLVRMARAQAAPVAHVRGVRSRSHQWVRLHLCFTSFFLFFIFW